MTFKLKLILLLTISIPIISLGNILPPKKLELDTLKKAISQRKRIKSKVQENKWAGLYLEAKKNLDEKNYKISCTFFKKLSRDKIFPLKDLAFIYELKACSYSKAQLIKLWRTKGNKLPRWALEDYYNISFELAKKYKIKNYMAFFLSKISRYKKNKKEREITLLEAIKYNKKPNYLRSLYKLSPRFRPKITRSNIYWIARDWENVRDFKKARNLYRKIINGKAYSVKEKVKAWNRYRLSYKKERNIQTYINKTSKMGEWLKPLIKKHPKNLQFKEYLAKNQINLARAIWTDHNRAKAYKILENILTWYKRNGDYLAEVYWVLGSMELEKKDMARAIYYYEKGAKLNISDKDMKDRINWALGWNNYLSKNYKKAIKEFNRYLKQTESYPLKNKLRYWKAINQKRLGKFSKYKKTLKKQIKKDPFSYYSILAHKELGIPLSPLGDLEIKKNVYVLPTFEWLVAMDEIVSAKNYLKKYAYKLYTTKMIKKVLPLFARINWYKEGIAQFQRIDPKDQPRILGREVPLIYPRPYLNDVMKLSKKHNVEDALIYSITRQESAFDPNARSWADAYGLMQITPEVANRLAKRFDFSYDRPGDLFDPKINLKLGAVLIKDLMARFKNQYVLFVGSYNASYKSVQRWKKERFSGDYIEFIELIPYEETMNYIKLVTRNFFIYKRLEANESFYFPDKFFESF